MSREELPGDRLYDAAWNGRTEPVLRTYRLLESTKTPFISPMDDIEGEVRSMQWLCWYVGSCTDWAVHVSKFREIHEKTGLQYRDIALKSIDLLVMLGDMTETVVEAIRWLHDNYGVDYAPKLRL